MRKPKFLEFLFPELFALVKSEGFNQGYQARYKEEVERNRLIRESELIPVGSKVISIGNEWEEMIVGTIRGYERELPIVFDELSQEEFLCFSVTVPYHDGLLNALLKLNPYERFALITGGKHNYIFDKKTDEEHRKILDPDEIHQRLKSFKGDQA